MDDAGKRYVTVQLVIEVPLVSEDGGVTWHQDGPVVLGDDGYLDEETQVWDDGNDEPWPWDDRMPPVVAAYDVAERKVAR